MIWAGVIWAGVFRRARRGEHERKKPVPPAAEEPEAVADRGKDGVDRVAIAAEQEVSVEIAIGLHLADQRLDGIAASEFPPDGPCMCEVPFMWGSGPGSAERLPNRPCASFCTPAVK